MMSAGRAGSLQIQVINSYFLNDFTSGLSMFGSHLSISGGMYKAIAEAKGLDMQTVQVFTKNQQQWKVPPLKQEVVDRWKADLAASGFKATVSHDSYLINLASPEEALWLKSIDLFIEEVRRCDLLGIPYLVTHPGAHVGSGEADGLKRVAEALDRVYEAVPDVKVVTCLESTAGMGTSLGHRLGHLAQIRTLAKHKDWLGVCLDTAHLFAAGYDFRGKKYKDFRKELDAMVGIEHVKVWHLNDSKKDLGSKVDRHEHIGQGFIGLDGFKPIVRDEVFINVPKILETAKDKHEDGRPWDAVNLETLRKLMK